MPTNADKIDEYLELNPTDSLEEKQLLNILGLETLAGIDLSNAYLPNANLRHADLSNTNLGGAILWQAKLSFANLSGATLMNPDPIGQQTDLSGADLSGAYFKSSDMN